MITPVEIQSKSFKSGIGYDKKDVDSFMTEILENYEELYRSNVEMKDKINMLNEGLQHYKNIEASLQKALVLAEKTSEETIRTAEMKAQAIELEAVNKAKEHTADAKNELERVHNQTVSLVQQYTKYKAQFTHFLKAQMDLLTSDTFKVDPAEFGAFAKSIASANDAYMNTNPMADFIAEGEQTPLAGYNTGDTGGTLGERDDADRYNDPFVSATGNNLGNSDSFVDPFVKVEEKKKAEASKKVKKAEEKPEKAEKEEASGEALEGEVEDKVDKHKMLEDEDANASGFTFI